METNAEIKSPMTLKGEENTKLNDLNSDIEETKALLRGLSDLATYYMDYVNWDENNPEYQFENLRQISDTAIKRLGETNNYISRLMKEIA